MSRLGSVAADPKNAMRAQRYENPLPRAGKAGENEQQRDSTDTQKLMDFQMVNNSQLNIMIKGQDLNQSIQSLN